MQEQRIFLSSEASATSSYRGREPFSNAASTHRPGSCCHSSPDFPPSSTGLAPLQKSLAAGMLSGQGLSACTLRVFLCVLVQSLQQMWGRAVSAVAGTLADSLPSFFHSIWKIH